MQVWVQGSMVCAALHGASLTKCRDPHRALMGMAVMSQPVEIKGFFFQSALAMNLFLDAYILILSFLVSCTSIYQTVKLPQSNR